MFGMKGCEKCQLFDSHETAFHLVTFNGAFTSLGIMGKTFSRRRKVRVNATSWRCYDSTSVRQLGPNLVNRVAQLVTYGDSLFTSDAHDHVGPQRKRFERRESLTQYKRRRVNAPFITYGAFTLLVITRRLVSDDAHVYAYFRQRPFMCTPLGI